MRSAVVRILQYDDVLYRSYRRQGTEVQVYVAYWKPGSVPYGQAGVHTPDTCWVNAGWTMDAKTNCCEMTGGPRSSKLGEWRQFSLKGTSLQVFFWHLVGDRVHNYDQYGWRNGFFGLLDRVPNLFRDIRRYGFNLAQEQLFIRISSNVDFDTLKEDPAFGELLSRLDGLGLLKPTKPAN